MKMPHNTRVLRIAALSAVMIILFTLSNIHAQSSLTGSFEGNVSDAVTGVPIPGAIVTITNSATGFVYNLTTNSRGRFWQGELAPGSYTISIAVANYKPQLLQRSIEVSANGD